MTSEEVWSILNEISYKPGWSFDFDGYATITVAATVVNSREDPLWETLTMRMVVDCSLSTSKNELLFEVMKTIAIIEVHEVMEFFRYQDKIVFDPHDYYKPIPLRVERHFSFDPEEVVLP